MTASEFNPMSTNPIGALRQKLGLVNGGSTDSDAALRDVVKSDKVYDDPNMPRLSEQEGANVSPEQTPAEKFYLLLSEYNAKYTAANLPAVQIKFVAAGISMPRCGLDCRAPLFAHDLGRGLKDKEDNRLPEEAMDIILSLFDLGIYWVFSDATSFTLVFCIQDDETPRQARKRCLDAVRDRLRASGRYELGD